MAFWLTWPFWAALGGIFIMADLLKEIREAKTVQDGLIAQNRMLREKLTEVEADLSAKNAESDALDEAIDLLDAMEAEGEAALLENTEFSPSGNA